MRQSKTYVVLRISGASSSQLESFCQNSRKRIGAEEIISGTGLLLSRI